MPDVHRRRRISCASLAVGLVGVLAVGCTSPVSEAVSVEDPTFIGITTDPIKNLSPDNSADIFALSADGSGGIIHELAPTYFPSMHRLGNGFIAPDENSLVLFDSSLKEVIRHEVPGLSVGMQSKSAQSPTHKNVAFSFNEGTAEAQYRHRIVAATEGTVVSTMTDQYIIALTACDDGSTRWVEYFPDLGIEDPVGPGSISIMTLHANGQHDEMKIDWKFSHRPSRANVLNCNDSGAYIVTEEEILHIKDKHSTPESIGQLPKLEFADRARFDAVSGQDYYAFTSAGMLTHINIPEGKIVYEHEIDLKDTHPVSITFDSGRAYVVTESDQDQGLLAIDLDDPTCVSEQLVLTGFNKKLTANKPKSSPSILIESIMPIDPHYPLDCS